MSALSKPELCDDEGCPHHGTPHVCSAVDGWQTSDAWLDEFIKWVDFDALLDRAAEKRQVAHALKMANEKCQHPAAPKPPVPGNEVVEARRAALEEAAKQVPTNWLDPLLTGPDKVTGLGDGNAIEFLLLAVRKRILALVPSAEAALPEGKDK